MRLTPDDYYRVDQRALAGYFEKEWFDHVLKQNPDVSNIFRFPVFDAQMLHSNDVERFTEFLSQCLKRAEVHPKSMLEVGSSLGRNFYEICKRIPSVKTASLIEPSQSFARTFEQIFEKPLFNTFPALHGNGGLTRVEFDSTEVRAACSYVKRSLINLPYEKVSDEVGLHDLVICSNVIDQCKDPEALVEFLKNRTSPQGVLAISCSYQWQKKYIDLSKGRILDINQFFDQSWERLGETNIDFRFRKSERFWYSFMSHVLVLRRN